MVCYEDINRTEKERFPSLFYLLRRRRKEEKEEKEEEEEEEEEEEGYEEIRRKIFQVIGNAARKLDITESYLCR
jgi:hypothetical protein